MFDPEKDTDDYPAVPAYEDEHEAPIWFAPLILLSVAAICFFAMVARLALED